MKIKLHHILYSLIVTFLLTTQTVYAEFTLVETGKVTSISDDSIIIDDAQFRLSPTLKVNTANKEKSDLNDVKVGDFVRVSIFKFNKRMLVGTIDLLDGPLQEASEH